jgi:hypothetical protein
LQSKRTTSPPQLFNLGDAAVQLERLRVFNCSDIRSKTSTCRELQKILPRNVFLDGDWYWDMRPFIVTDETMSMEHGNITYLLNSFLRCAEFENIIFCWVIHKQEISNGILRSLTLDTCAVHRFSLICDTLALTERLNRDIIERSMERIRLYDALDTIIAV